MLLTLTWSRLIFLVACLDDHIDSSRLASNMMYLECDLVIANFHLNTSVSLAYAVKPVRYETSDFPKYAVHAGSAHDNFIALWPRGLLDSDEQPSKPAGHTAPAVLIKFDQQLLIPDRLGECYVVV